MTSFLLLTVYAPLSSWGDIAVGETRGSWDRPSRSAILGLIAAALGVARDQIDTQHALEAGYGVAVRMDASGDPMVDYHITQSVSIADVRAAQQGGPALSRAALFSLKRKPQTVLSSRTYLQDTCSTVVLWARPGARWSLEALATALHAPHFVLYAGRKANPLGLPLRPEIVHADTLAHALSRRSLLPAGLDPLPAALVDAFRSGPREVATDPCGDEGFASGLKPLREEQRRDRCTHRGRWQFSNRRVEVGLWEPAASADPTLPARGVSS